jgi:hypothetical protein
MVSLIGYAELVPSRNLLEQGLPLSMSSFCCGWSKKTKIGGKMQVRRILMHIRAPIFV